MFLIDVNAHLPLVELKLAQQARPREVAGIARHKSEGGLKKSLAMYAANSLRGASRCSSPQANGPWRSYQGLKRMEWPNEPQHEGTAK